MKKYEREIKNKLYPRTARSIEKALPIMSMQPFDNDPTTNFIYRPKLHPAW
jgi:hypothetical protein